MSIIEKPGEVEPQLREKSSRYVKLRWNLPRETGGAPLVAVIVRVTYPNGMSENHTFAPDITNKTFEGLNPYSNYVFEFVAKNQVLQSLSVKLEITTSEEGN